MKNKAWAVIFAASFGLAVTAAPARGQFYVGVRGGASNENASRTGGALGKIDFDSSSAFLYGAQIGFKLSAVAVEGEIYRADHNLMQSGLSTSAVDMNYYYVGVNVKLGIPLVVLYPYVTAGYGRYSAKLSSIGQGSDSAFNVGAGAELTIGRIGVFAEARYTDFGFDLANLSWDFGGLDLHFGLNVHF